MILSNGLLSASQINSLYTFDNLLNASQIKGNFTKNLIGGSLGNEDLLSYIQNLIDSFKTRVANEGGTFEAIDCLFSNLTTLDDYQVDTNAQIVRDYAKRVIADGGVVEGFENVITSIKTLNNSDLYDKASLSLFPSGVKEGKAYSILPTNGDGDFGVIRNTTKTRTNGLVLIETVAANVPSLNYDTVGGAPSLLLEPQRTNLITYSENYYDASWTKSQTFISNSSIAAPFVGKFGLKITTSNINTECHIRKPQSGNQLSHSIYAKKGELNYLLFRTNLGGLFSHVVFNLDTGTIAVNQTPASFIAKIENAGNGWYRCSVYIASFSSTSLMIWIISNTADINSTAPVGSGLFLFGAQQENSVIPTSYIPTVATAVTRNADLISKTGISNLIGQTKGAFFFEGENIPNNLEQCIGVSYGITDYISLAIESGKVTLQYRTTEQGYLSSSYIVNTLNQKIKAIINYQIGVSAKLFLNGQLVATLPTPTHYFSQPLSVIGSSRFTNSQPFYGYVKNLQLYKTGLTDAECVTLTTL
jgi:hypothetical protein